MVKLTDSAVYIRTKCSIENVKKLNLWWVFGKLKSLNYWFSVILGWFQNWSFWELKLKLEKNIYLKINKNFWKKFLEALFRSIVIAWLALHCIKLAVFLIFRFFDFLSYEASKSRFQNYFQKLCNRNKKNFLRYFGASYFFWNCKFPNFYNTKLRNPAFKNFFFNLEFFWRFFGASWLKKKL